jgi:hypothetical protein
MAGHDDGAMTTTAKLWIGVAIAIVIVAVATIILMAMTEMGGSDPQGPSPNPSPAFEIPQNFQNISSWVSTESDCDTLQNWFDLSYTAHGNQSTLDAMEWLTDLMSRIDARMESVGCYA